ncbi:MAG: hypothetical protein QXR45_04265 [Candidatus Bathyarchaeia archaeon]
MLRFVYKCAEEKNVINGGLIVQVIYILRFREKGNNRLNNLLAQSFRSDYKSINWRRDWETIIRKISMIEACLPVSSVIDFGGMWEVDGLYSRICMEKFNVSRVTMIDKFESENWVKNPLLRANIDFRKGDFSDEGFMAGLKESYDLALAYDVLLHQRDPIRTLSLMLSKTKKFFLISQPILPERLMPFRNCLILLSGSREKRLVPFHEKWTREINYWSNFSDATIMNSDHWLWGMTPSFIESLMAGLGWRIIYKAFWRGWLPKYSKWELCGLIFTKI